ncbi:MAG: VCBS repeat-containing protein, partial [Bacteroidota bacterium]
DLFILNHNILPINNFKPSEMRITHDSNVGDKLYENMGGKFQEVTQEVGIHTNPLGYGLGVSVGDLNNDGYPDIYVANDFLEHDYCYLNQGDGTFKDVVKSAMPQVSQFSMGTDLADFNNDGWMDLITVDMVAEDNYRQKTTMRPMSRDKFYYAVEDGFHYQYMHNALQLNRGGLHFSNISKHAGISETDWSWAPLFIDLDLDGWKDIAITNGYKKDISNKDYLTLEKKKLKEYQTGEISNTELFRALLDAAPVTKIENYVFRNRGDYTFEKMNTTWGFDKPAFSNGAAYGDLDNDGDLEIVINNIDQEAFIYKNLSREQQSPHFIQLKLVGPPQNPLGIGAKVELYTPQDTQYLEHYLTRGFQSSSDPLLTFGLGRNKKITELAVRWHDGNVTLLRAPSIDQIHEVRYDEAQTSPSSNKRGNTLVTDITQSIGLEVTHEENAFDDFSFEVLLPHKMSQWGPALATGDLNGDQLDDFFLGGSAGFPGQIHLQQQDGSFALLPQPTFVSHVAAEDVGAAFFDADGDGDLDLYVVSGGNEYEPKSRLYHDRLYLNDGRGQLSWAETMLPALSSSGSVVRPFDFDQDGDLDLFVGGRMIPRAYPKPTSSFLLVNESGTFIDKTQSLAPALNSIGRVTDAVWSDFDQDQQVDLLLTGEWMGLSLLRQDKGHFSSYNSPQLAQLVGWGFSLAAGDFDSDGDPDYVLGNLGTNYKYKTSYEEPFQVYLNDFDENGSLDIVLGYYEAGTLYPLRGKQCSSEQMPFISEKFPTYDLFAQSDLSTIYGESSLDSSLHYKATEFRSLYIENREKKGFSIQPLPNEAQFSAINSMLIYDANEDGHLDLLTAGNLFSSEVETPRNDAGVGLILLGDGKGNFTPSPPFDSGLYLPYDVKHLRWIRTKNGKNRILVGSNGDRVRVLEPLSQE